MVPCIPPSPNPSLAAAEEAGAGEVLKADEVVPLESAQVKHSAADFNAEEIPMATSIFKGMDYARTKGPPESLRVRPRCWTARGVQSLTFQALAPLSPPPHHSD